MRKDFHQNVYTESRCVTGPEKHCLQACPCIFQPERFTGWCSEGVNCSCLSPTALPHTFEERVDGPYGEGSETGELTKGDLQTEERYAHEHQADEVRDEEGT